jgi:hypothetical protein
MEFSKIITSSFSQSGYHLIDYVSIWLFFLLLKELLQFPYIFGHVRGRVFVGFFFMLFGLRKTYIVFITIFRIETILN